MHWIHAVDKPPHNSPLMSIRNLSVRFATDSQTAEAVQGVSIDLYRGERYALVGESGSGKTVTALSMLRLLPDAQTSGQVLWQASPQSPAQDLLSCSDREVRALRGRDIAMIFQEPMSALNPLYTVGEQIAEVLEVHHGLSKREALARAVSLLERTGVDEPQRRAAAYPHQLSGGQRQRVVIAMALACSPQLLIADEPTTALDVTIREQVLELLLDLQRQEGMAILLITRLSSGLHSGSVLCSRAGWSNKSQQQHFFLRPNTTTPAVCSRAARSAWWVSPVMVHRSFPPVSCTASSRYPLAGGNVVNLLRWIGRT
jgi:microcin C transport system ATP-binding protein